MGKARERYDLIWLAAFPSAIMAVIALGAIFYWARRREGAREALNTAVASAEAAARAAAAWESNYEAEQARAERLELQLQTSKLRIESLEERVADLERELTRRPDMTVLLDLIETRTTAILAAIAKEATP